MSLVTREATLRTLKACLTKAQCRMKSQADKKRTDGTYDIGDWAYIKFQPYIQLSLRSHTFHKLSAKFFGPFQITAKVGQVAYTLDLPEDAKIHPIFHISQLKRKLGSQSASATLLVFHSDSGHALLTPEVVLDRRLI
ncbi:uncharacterized protein LOC132631528 [Lycium barbarum]|uniref:uncharacterized protein LOC132631528 n=1 Tax=Lycium barbarum TaxID=112863 RepID=UPI00293E3195|nr:uncharacterized protein LOC132631528 [Lycium barbarum]